MPTFDFACHDCNHQFEHLVLPAPKPQAQIACPSCESQKVQKLISAPNVQFKGSGYYSTDNKKAASAPAPAPKTEKKEAQ